MIFTFFEPKSLNTRTCTRMFMVTKTLTIMEDAYEMLARRKGKEESFSDVIRRVVGKEKNIMRFAGAWKDMSDKEAERMKKHIKDLNKRATKELFQRLKKYDLP